MGTATKAATAAQTAAEARESAELTMRRRYVEHARLGAHKHIDRACAAAEAWMLRGEEAARVDALNATREAVMELNLIRSALGAKVTR